MPDRSEASASDTPAPALDRRIGTALLVLAFLFLAVSQLRTIAEPEFWSHLAQGRAFAERGAAAGLDTLTFTIAGRPIHTPFALYDRLLFGLWSAGGAPLTTLAHIALLLAAAALARRAAPSASRTPAAGAIALGLAGWLMAPGAPANPRVFSLFFIALFLHEYTRERSPLRLALTLLPAQILWTNLDSAFLLGPLLALFGAADFWAERRAAGGATADERRRIVLLGGLALALLAATLINPNGAGLLSAAAAEWSRPAHPGFWVWLSPYSHVTASPLFRNWTVAVLLIGALGLVAHAQRLPLLITAAAVTGGFLALRSVAATSLFALLALPFLVLALNAIGREGGALCPPGLFRGAEERARATALVVALLLAGSSLLFVTNRLYRGVGAAARFGLGVEERVFPAAAAELLARPDFPARVLHLPHDGGYLAWRHPDRPVFCDLRRGAYDPEFKRLVGRWIAGESGLFEAIARRYDASALLLNCLWPGAGRMAREAMGLGWTLEYFDGTGAVLLARGATAGHLDAETREAGLRRLEAEVNEFAAQLAKGRRPALAPAVIGAGELFSALERHREAAEMYGLLAKAAPRSRFAQLQLGIELARAGRADEAIQPLEAAVAANRKNGVAWFWLAQAYARLGRETESQRAAQQAERWMPKRR